MKIIIIILSIVWLWSNYKEKEIKNEQTTGWKRVKKNIRLTILCAIICCIVWSVLVLFFSVAGKIIGISLITIYSALYLYRLCTCCHKYIVGIKNRSILYSKYISEFAYIIIVFAWAIISIF